MNSALEDELKLAMRGLAKSVVIITTALRGERHAMAATAVTPLSMEPPSMLFCINRTASAYPILLDGAGFCINLLAMRHEPMARLCSGPAKGESRFKNINFAMDEDGVPYFADSQASVTCVQDGRVAYGSHDVFFGKVKKVRVGGHIEPLIYVDGVYKGLAG
jgi:flavin reductase (DIM6/NTAB) family NADH-FMN oxidoreductase RutF